MKQTEWIQLDAIGSLYQEAILVYFDVPELFVCIDDRGRRYLTLCLSPEEGRYLIAPISLRYLDALLNQKCRIRECFCRSVDEVSFLTSYDTERMIFSCDRLHSTELPEEYLPEEDAVYDVPFDLFMTGYREKIDGEFRKRWAFSKEGCLHISAATQDEKRQYYHVILKRQHERYFAENRRYINAKRASRGDL